MGREEVKQGKIDRAPHKQLGVHLTRLLYAGTQLTSHRVTRDLCNLGSCRQSAIKQLVIASSISAIQGILLYLPAKFSMLGPLPAYLVSQPRLHAAKLPHNLQQLCCCLGCIWVAAGGAAVAAACIAATAAAAGEIEGC